ncbi:MAG: hypothetical protein JXQ27_09690 [Acidobacteria bacterium]|nr:hypothetical protein [Acidobacteriota bacterium]
MATSEKSTDNQWDERPVGMTGATTRTLGWLFLVVWAVGCSGYGLWQLAVSPEGLFEKLLVFGGLTGVGLLFVSVLVDRIRRAKTDRYKEVRR